MKKRLWEGKDEEGMRCEHRRNTSDHLHGLTHSALAGRHSYVSKVTGLYKQGASDWTALWQQMSRRYAPSRAGGAQAVQLLGAV